MKVFTKLFQGRINRRTFGVGIFLFLCFLFIILPFSSKVFFNSNTYTVVLIIEVLILYFFLLSIAIRRSHDVSKKDQNTRFIDLWLIIGLLKTGEKKKNRYGKPPESKIDIKGLFGISRNA